MTRTGARSRLVAHNTVWNLAGWVLPVPAALLCIPLLTSALGVERFGALGIAWLVIGYFGLFDFGLSQSTTRFAAAELAGGRDDGLRSLLANSLLLHTALGFAGGALLAALVPWLVGRQLAIPAALSREVGTALYWLVVSIPAIVVTSAFRGMLEGMQRFDLVNVIRVPATVVNYLGPVLALPFGNSLPLIVGVIVVARYAVLIAYSATCLAVLPRGRVRLEGATARRLATYGGWLTVSNLLNPLITAMDRFVIASAVSIAAVAFYVTPFEIVTKAWILSASLMGALFPVLAALAHSDPGAVRPACRAAAAYLAAFAAPAVAILLGCADWLLDGWLGPEFRDHSAGVARLLGAGIVVNVIAQVPLTALHAMGRADVTAKIIAAELPFYALGTWYCSVHYGIEGVAAAWAARAAVDAALLHAAAGVVLPRAARRPDTRKLLLNAGTLCLFLAAFWLAALCWRDAAAQRIAALAALMVALLAWEWLRLIRPLNHEFLPTPWNRPPGNPTP